MRLVCPHCQKSYRLVGWADVQGWYGDHVTHCQGAPGHLVDRLRRALDQLKPGTPAVADQLSMQGRFLIGLVRDGELLDARVGSNLIVNNGRALFIDRLQNVTTYEFGQEAIGTDYEPPSVNDVILAAQVAVQPGTLSQPTAYTDRLVTTFGPGVGTGAIFEAGRFGYDFYENFVLVARIIFARISKAAADTLIVTHDLSL